MVVTIFYFNVHIFILYFQMTCLFWKKKTDVVDLKKEEQAAARKKTLTVDRSERSRRVLKMESTRETPKERDESDTRRSINQSSKMFLPSENPTGILFWFKFEDYCFENKYKRSA